MDVFVNNVYTMKSVSCIVVGSELLVVSTLEKFFQRLVGIRIEATFMESTSAVTFVNENKPALLILDMQMSDMSSFNFLSSLKQHPGVILIGDSIDNFPVGVDAAIIGFLEKPLSFESFVACIQRAMDWISQWDDGHSSDYLFLKENRKMVRVVLRNIQYVESFKDYVVIHCSDKIVRVRQPMSMLESKLDKLKFLRIHRSYLVALEKIDSFSSISVDLSGYELPIGRSFQKDVLAVLSDRFCIK